MDNVRKVGNVSKYGPELVVHTLFNRQLRKFRKRKMRKTKRKVEVRKLTEEVDTLLADYKCCNFCFRMRTFVLGLPRKYLLMLLNILENWLASHDIPARIPLMVKDMIAYRKRAPNRPTDEVDKKRKQVHGVMVVHFHNKGIEMVDLPKILNSRYVRDAIPSFLSESDPPMISYSYTKNISSMIFNQKRVIEDLDFNVGTEGLQCQCSMSDFCYQPVGHVVTGDLTIIRDAKLRHLIAKGPSYREQNVIDWTVNAKICKVAVSKYKHKWSKKESVDSRALNEWEHKVHECIDEKIRLLKMKHINKRKKHVLRTEKHLNSLQELKHDYVLVPADKAPNNVIVVCKKYYLDVVLNELNSTNTYVHENRECGQVVTEHLQFMVANGIDVKAEHKALPSFYWLPKLHKQPYGKRFIAASNKCSTKSLSKLLTACLAMITCHFKEYCNGIYSNTGVNCFWIIENSQQVLDHLVKINYFSSAMHADSFDFSNLYTSIPHASLKKALVSLIKEAYKVRDSIFLVVNRCGKAHWSDSPSRAASSRSITEDKLVELVEYLIDNIYINVGNRVFRQQVGIPMGTDCAPLLANLFLFYYEYRYMKGLIKNNITLAKRFNFTTRYIDDVLTLNNSRFVTEIRHIYPSELDLKRTTENSTSLSYLDVLITIDKGKYSTDVYDKRDDFGFNIVNFPHLCGNIPSKPAYGVYISQLVRIGRICSTYLQFKDRHYTLTAKLVRQGFWYGGLCRAFRRFSRIHASIFSGFGCSVHKHIQEGICLPATEKILGRHITTRS